MESAISQELQDLFREADEALEAYSQSISKGLELSRGLIAACDGIDHGMADSWAELGEWV